MKMCIVGASGKLGQYMLQHALDRGYEVNAVCRERSVGKLARFSDGIALFPGATNDTLVREAPAIVGRQTRSARAYVSLTEQLLHIR